MIRYRLKRGVSSDTILGSSTTFTIKSAKKLEEYFLSYSAFRDYFDRNMDYQYIKCRKCEECRAEYARDWSIRCAHEFQIVGKGAFITLTIDDIKVNLFNSEKNLRHYCKRCVKGNRYIKYPINYTLCKGMLLDELKRMRDKIFKRYGISIRYFGCGEYGSDVNTERPHYHILIFGYDFPDKYYLETSKKGIPIYFSEELQSFWKYGIAKLQEINHRACMYTAKYCLKKLKFCDDISEIEQYYGREPEFLVMSRGSCNSKRCPHIDEIIKNCKSMSSLKSLSNPYCKDCKFKRGGIGFDWFSHYYNDVLKIGYITLDGIKYPIPKYYLDILKLTDEYKYDKHKLILLNRIDELEDINYDLRSSEHLKVKKKINKSRLKFYHRE